MAKVKIKALRSFHLGDRVMMEGKTVAVDEEEAAMAVKYGWAALVESSGEASDGKKESGDA